MKATNPRLEERQIRTTQLSEIPSQLIQVGSMFEHEGSILEVVDLGENTVGATIMRRIVDSDCTGKIDATIALPFQLVFECLTLYLS